MAADNRLEHELEKRAMLPADKEVPTGEIGDIAVNYGSLVFRPGGLTIEETFNIAEVPITNLLRMYRQDGQISGLYSLMKLPLIATEFDIIKKDRRSGTEADRIRQNFLEPPHAGGMSTSMRYIKSDMAMASLTAFRGYEKVFEIRDGYVVLRKLAPRNPTTITILQDAHGGFAGFKQKFIKANPQGLTEVTIERERSLLYAANREDNPLYGKSDFLSAYYHYDKLHKLYYVAHMAFQALVLPPRVGTYPPNADPKDVTTFFEGIKRLGFDTALMVKEGYKVESFGTDRPGMNFMDLIEHHIGQMSKSVLASYMDLGSGKGRGSFALSKDLSAIWIMSVGARAKDIDDTFNWYVIPQLTDFNSNSRKYPRMQHLPLSGEKKDAIANIYTKLMASPSDHASPEFLLALEEQLAKDLELNEIDYDEIRKERQKEITDARVASQQKKNGAVAALMETLKIDAGGNVSLTDRSWDLIKTLSEERQEAFAQALVEKRLALGGPSA